MNLAQLIDPEALDRPDGLALRPSPQPPRGVVTRRNGIETVEPMPAKGLPAVPAQIAEPIDEDEVAELVREPLLIPRAPQKRVVDPRSTGATAAILAALADVSEDGLRSGVILRIVNAAGVKCAVGAVASLLASLAARNEVEKLGSQKPFRYRLTARGRRRLA